MLGEVFHVDFAVVAQSGVHSEESGINALDFHALHQLAAKVETGSRSHHSTLILGKDALVAVGVFGSRLALDIQRDRSLAKSEKVGFKLIVRAVVEESQSAASRSGVVDNLSHHRVVESEIELVADADFACRLHEHVPQLVLFIQLTQQEHLDFGTGLFLVAVEASREHLGVIEDEAVAIVEVVENLLKHTVLNFTGLAMENQKTRFIAHGSRFACNQLLGQLKFKLR